MKTKELLSTYATNVENVVESFLSKHGIEAPFRHWLSDIIGGTLDATEYIISFTDMVVDLKYDTPKGMYLDYMRDIDEFYRTIDDYIPMVYISYVKDKLKDYETIKG